MVLFVSAASLVSKPAATNAVLKAFINATHDRALGNVQAIEDDFSEDGNAPLHCLSICWTEFALYVIRFMEDGWE